MRRTGVRTLRRGFQARDATLYIGVEDQVPQDRQGPLQSRWPLEVQLAVGFGKMLVGIVAPYTPGSYCYWDVRTSGGSGGQRATAIRSHLTCCKRVLCSLVFCSAWDSRPRASSRQFSFALAGAEFGGADLDRIALALGAFLFAVVVCLRLWSGGGPPPPDPPSHADT